MASPTVLLHVAGDPVATWLSRQLAGIAGALASAAASLPADLHTDWDDPWQAPVRLQHLVAQLKDRAASVQGVEAGQGLFLLGLAAALASLDGQAVLLHWRQGTMRLVGQLTHLPPLPPLAPPDAAAVRAMLEQDQGLVRDLCRLREQLRALKVARCIVALDDLLAEPHSAQGQAAWTGLQQALPRLSPAETTHIQQALQEHVASLVAAHRPGPWWPVLQREGPWLPSVDARPSFLRPQVVTQPPGHETRADGNWVRLGPLPPLMHEGESTLLGGTVLVPPHGNDGNLWLAQHQEATGLQWRQSSPGVAKALPGRPGSDAARFRLTRIHARAAHPVHLRHRLNTADAPFTELARIDFLPTPGPRVPGLLVGDFPLGYTPIPKVACTSIKSALFQLMAGERFGPELGLGARHIHDYFDRRSVDIGGLTTRLLVVRDPLKRFLSGFSNRVLHHRELSADYLQRQPFWSTVSTEDWIFDPDLETFVEHLPRYLQVPTIRHHFQPITEIVPSLSLYTRVYAFEELDAFASDVSRHVGRPLQLPHEQRGGPKLGLDALTSTAIDRLLRYYAQDYLALEGLYRAP